MKSFKTYFLLQEKKRKIKKHKKSKKSLGIYGVPLYWNSYPAGGFVDIEADTSNE
jgi:hypothetical protein